MKYRSSTETSYHILGLLADRTEYAQADMEEAIGKDYRTIMRHLYPLETMNLIKVARHEPSSRRGKDKNIYKITSRGILALLKLPPIYNDLKIIDTIIRSHVESFPLIFKNWNFFRERGISGLILSRLKAAIDQEIDPLTFVTMIPQRGIFVRDQSFSDDKEFRKFAVVYQLAKYWNRPRRALSEADTMVQGVLNAHDTVMESTLKELEFRICKKVFYTLKFDESSDQMKFYSVLAKNEEIKSFINSLIEEDLSDLSSFEKTWGSIVHKKEK